MKPYNVIAMHRIDGQVLLGEFDSKAERDRCFADWKEAWRNGSLEPDVKEILRGDVHGMTPKAEETDEADMVMALALIALAQSNDSTLKQETLF